MAKPADLAVGEWWKATVQTGSKIRDVLASPAAGGDPTTLRTAWCGTAYDSLRKEILLIGGGHNTYHGNEVYAFSLDPLSANFLKWRIKNYYSASTVDSEDNADGTPTPPHSYDSFLYHPVRDTAIRMPGVAPDFGSGTFTIRTYEFNCTTESPTVAVPSSWTRRADAASGGAAGISSYDPTSQKMFGIWNGGSSEGGIRSFNPATNAWVSHTTFDDQPNNPHNMTSCIAPVGPGYMAWMGGSLQMKRLDTFAYVGTSASYGATGDTAIQTPTAPGFIWCPIGDFFVGWSGLQASGVDRRDWYKLPSPESGSKVWARQIGTGDIPPAPLTNGTYTAFNYAYDGLCYYVPDIDTETYVVRVAPSAGAPANPAIPSGLGAGQRFRGIKR